MDATPEAMHHTLPLSHGSTSSVAAAPDIAHWRLALCEAEEVPAGAKSVSPSASLHPSGTVTCACC